MSNPPSAHDQDATARETADGQESVDGALETVAPTLAGPIRMAGFWGAIALPILYLPVLANGLSTSFEAGLFLGLILLNLVALYVGHAHHRRQ
ncbi:hypothetical protein [Natronorubrum halophilum]|uniref:hypothetical protein n=1 Tax=Natronorubrum halophilum TaxID=1702106 RepID=UPI0010C1D12B|nr:hypothetical protein [Natronorubrum halophilum]